MEERLTLVGEALKDFAVFASGYCLPFVTDIFDTSVIIAKVILVFSIPYTFFYFEKKTTDSLLLSEAQKHALTSLSLYTTIVSFPIAVFIISYFIDYVILFLKTFDSSILLIVVCIFLYIIMLYKYLFMLISFKKNALVVTKFFLITLPFVFVCLEHMRWPFNELLKKPVASTADGMLFFGVCLFSVPYLLFFTFSKRIKTAWVDTPPLPKKVPADPH